MEPSTLNLRGFQWASAAAIALAMIALAAVSLSDGAEALSEGEEFTADDIVYEVTDEHRQYVNIIGYVGSPVRVEGTVSYDGIDWTVESVGEGVFWGCEFLREVSLPSATSVGEDAFWGCEFLREVSLPSATSVGDNAFSHCENLAYVRFSDSLDYLGPGAFDASFYSGDTELDGDAETLRGREFVGPGDGNLYEGFSEGSVCYALLSDGRVSAAGFVGAPESLSVPSMVKHGGAEYFPVAIVERAFAECETLVSVSIGTEVASIGDNALDSPYLASIEVLGDNATFASVDGVLYDKEVSTLLKFPASKRSLDIPATVKEIASMAFMGAGAALKDEDPDGNYFRYVKIPATVTTIGYYAFCGSALECLKFSGGEVSIGDYAFAECYGLNYIVFGADFAEVGNGAFLWCKFYDENERPMDFSAEAMAGHKFTGVDATCLELYVPPLRGTIVYDGVKYRITDNGADSKIVTAVRLADDDATDIFVPASISYLGFEWTVTSIAPKAFLRNGSIVSVISEVDVGRSAFHGCRNLASVTLNGAASVGAYAFFGCSSLARVYLGGADTLGTSAFSGCGSLARIDLSGVASIGKHAFFGCGSLTYAGLSSVAFIGYGAFTGTDLAEVGFGGDLSHVDSKAFFGYSFLDGDGDKIKVNAGKLAGKHFSGGGKVLTQGP